MKYILTIVSHGDTPDNTLRHARAVVAMTENHLHDLMGMAAGDATGTASAEWKTLESVDDGDEATRLVDVCSGDPFPAEDKICLWCGGFKMPNQSHPFDTCGCHQH